MKLYDTAMAPNPRRVRWFMAEKGIGDIEIVQLNLIQGQHKQADYLAKAGLPNVPALELDDGTTITESLAICRYLEARYPEPNLFGRRPEEAAVVEMWTRRAEMLVANPFMLGVRHTHPALAALEAPNPPVGCVLVKDGRIIGAVTHVYLSDATQGYGMYIEWMLEKSDALDAEAQAA